MISSEDRLRRPSSPWRRRGNRESVCELQKLHELRGPGWRHRTPDRAERREIPAAAQTVQPLDATYVLTLEEIGNLSAEGGNPAETLTNVVALIGRRFKDRCCSAYLLEPDRCNLILAATLVCGPNV